MCPGVSLTYELLSFVFVMQLKCFVVVAVLAYGKAQWRAGNGACKSKVRFVNVSLEYFITGRLFRIDANIQ